MRHPLHHQRLDHHHLHRSTQRAPHSLCSAASSTTVLRSCSNTRHPRMNNTAGTTTTPSRPSTISLVSTARRRASGSSGAPPISSCTECHSTIGSQHRGCIWMEPLRCGYRHIARHILLCPGQRLKPLSKQNLSQKSLRRRCIILFNCVRLAVFRSTVSNSKPQCIICFPWIQH